VRIVRGRRHVSGPCVPSYTRQTQDAATLAFQPPSRRQAPYNELHRAPDTPYFKSKPFYQRYKSILPTSLTYILLIDQRLLTLNTRCGIGTAQNVPPGAVNCYFRAAGFSCTFMRYHASSKACPWDRNAPPPRNKCFPGVLTNWLVH